MEPLRGLGDLLNWALGLSRGHILLWLPEEGNPDPVLEAAGPGSCQTSRSWGGQGSVRVPHRRPHSRTGHFCSVLGQLRCQAGQAGGHQGLGSRATPGTPWEPAVGRVSNQGVARGGEGDPAAGLGLPGGAREAAGTNLGPSDRPPEPAGAPHAGSPGQGLGAGTPTPERGPQILGTHSPRTRWSRRRART